MTHRVRRIALATLALGAVATPAVAAPLHGTIAAYKHHSNGTGSLAVKLGSGAYRTFIVYDRSTCGISYGQSGDALPGGCKNLGKFTGKGVDVVRKAGSKHSTSLVSVNG